MLLTLLLACPTVTDDEMAARLDLDGDGIPWPEDCAPDDAEVNPDAPETCGNAVDDNCDGEASPACRLHDADATEALRTYDGDTARQLAGYSVATSGRRVIVGSPGWGLANTLDLATYDGRVQLTSGDNIRLDIRGDAEGWCGWQVAANDDNLAFSCPNTGGGAGAVGVFALSAQGTVAPWSGSAWFTGGALNEYLGMDVTWSGDDLIVSAPGGLVDTEYRGYIYRIDGSSLSMGTPSWLGPAGAEGVGTNLDGGCETDGDGVTEILVASPYDSVGAPSEGRVWLVPGDAQEGGLSLDDVASATFLGGVDGAALGYAVHCADDLDGDGNGEVVLIAAGLADAVRIFSLPDTEPRATINVPAEQLANAGDQDLDGRADLVLSGTTPDAEGAQAWVFAFAEGGQVSTDALASFTFSENSDLTPILAADAADLDDVGAPELIFGNPGWNGSTLYQGQAVVMTGAEGL